MVEPGKVDWKGREPDALLATWAEYYPEFKVTYAAGLSRTVDHDYRRDLAEFYNLAEIDPAERDLPEVGSLLQFHWVIREPIIVRPVINPQGEYGSLGRYPHCLLLNNRWLETRLPQLLEAAKAPSKDLALTPEEVTQNADREFESRLPLIDDLSDNAFEAALAAHTMDLALYQYEFSEGDSSLLRPMNSFVRSLALQALHASDDYQGSLENIDYLQAIPAIVRLAAEGEWVGQAHGNAAPFGSAITHFDLANGLNIELEELEVHLVALEDAGLIIRSEMKDTVLPPDWEPLPELAELMPPFTSYETLTARSQQTVAERSSGFAAHIADNPFDTALNRLFAMNTGIDPDGQSPTLPGP